MVRALGTRWLALVGAVVGAVATGGLRLGAQDPPVVSSLYSGLRWRCIGPFDGGRVEAVQGEPAEAGVYLVTAPGGVFKTVDGGVTWTSLDHPSTALIADLRQWVDPANPRRIAKVDDLGIAVSLDGGGTWTTSHNLPIAAVARLAPHERPVEPPDSRGQIAGEPVTAFVADPVRAGLLFAGTKHGVYMSLDKGARWSPLQLNLPSVAINDLDIRGNDLVAATEGRSVWTLEDISPLRQLDRADGPMAAVLFKPADAIAGTALALDYYLPTLPDGVVTLEVLDAPGRVVHMASSTAGDSTDRWLPVRRPLAATPGHHRVRWNLRVDPPPSPHHRFAHLARTLFQDAPSEPDGPRVPPGPYRLRLTAGGRTSLQPINVTPDPRASAADLTAARRQFDLAMKAYDAMEVAHRGFLQLVRLRAQIKPLLESPDADLAAALAELDTRLNVIDGSDWTGLVIPDADDEVIELEEEEGDVKHPDFIPPKPVSLSKDYDDPTSILGRAFANVSHPPALAILGATLGGVLTKAGHGREAPDALAIQNFADACHQLAGVLDEWRGVNVRDLPRLNTELARRKLPAMAVAADIPVIACPAK